MPNIRIILEGDGAWPDLKEKTFITGELTAVAFLQSGMTSGKPSVALRIELPDGRTVITQTSGRIFNGVNVALNSKFPDMLRD